ncbi:hypothetical protein INT45_013364 [Circinella minor]|uniref:Uncharacterized protein n=1 Tax=Circinella minor TaxID=1195481 RepID=A0A8H7S6F2_9FUNG|nr:hypothetical protein INT45_013364 [Circinella minor]
MLLPTFSTAPTSLPSPEEESIYESITTTTTTNQEAMLKSFVISTKKNTQYNQINDLLHQIHVMRYGDPELRERWWEQEQQRQQEEYNHHYNYQQQQQQQQLKQEIQMNEYIQQGGREEETGTIYESANATLRQAFLQRHHHHAV